MKNKSNLSLSLRKVVLSSLVAAPLATLPAPLWALPSTTGGNVTSSSATTSFQTVGTVLNITDTTATRLVLKWNEFGFGGSPIAAGETVIWNLPSSSSAVLNSVSTGMTVVNGALQSNGSIYILNPNGITLSSSATVTAQGLGLSTVPEAEFYFLANGSLSFVGNPTAGVSIAATGANAINVGSTGTVFVAGRTADISGNIQAGTLSVNTQHSLTSPGSVNLGSAAALSLGTNAASGVAGWGNLVVNSGGAPVNVAAGFGTNVRGGTATINSSGGQVSQTGANVFAVGDSINNSTLTLNTGTGRVILGSGTTAGVSAPNSPGNNPRVGVNLTAGVTEIVSATRIQLNSGGTVTGNTTVNPVALTVRANAGSIDSGGDVTVTNGTISLTTGANNSAISFRGPGDLTFSTISVTNSTGSSVSLVSTTGAVVLPGATIGGSITVTAQTNITQAGALTNTASGGGVTNRTASFDAVTGSITLTAANDFTRLVLKNAPSGSVVNEATSVLFGSGTSTTGAVNLASNGAILFGTASGDSVRFGGDLTVNSNGSLVTSTLDTGVLASFGGQNYGTDNLTVVGALNITAGAGNVVLAGFNNNGVALNNQFGVINVVSAANVRVYETTTLNLGNIVTSGTLRAYSSTGDVINSGAITGNPSLQVGAGSAVAPGDITVANAGNLFGSVVILDDFTVLSNAAVPVTVGSYLARNVTLQSSSSITLGTISSTSNTGILGNLTITAAGTGSSISSTQTIRVGGALTLVAADNVTVSDQTNPNDSGTLRNRFSSVAITAGGDVNVRSVSDLTASATLTQNAVGKTALIRSNGALTLGAVNSDYTGLVTFSAGNNGTAALQDSVAGMRVFGPVQFTSSGSVTINRAGHSFGRVGISAGNNRNATIVESGSLNLGSVSLTSGGAVTFTATSTTGDILQDVTANGINISNGGSSATFTATAGNVTINDTGTAGTNGGGNNIVARVNATAAGNVTINQGRNTSLGNITAGGRLTVDSSVATASITTGNGGSGYTAAPTVVISAPNLPGGVQAVATAVIDTVATSATFQQITGFVFSNGGSGYSTAPTVTVVGGTFTTAATPTGALGNVSITQASGSRLNVFDTVYLSSGGTGDITAANTGNRLGGVLLRANSGNITITESTTLNLKSVQTTGAFAATSEAGNIIDSGDGAVSVNSLGTSGTALGTASFSAPNGNIALTLSNSNFSTVGFTTGGNVTVTDGTGGTILGTSVIGGTLDVLNLAATQTVSQSGVLRVSGNVGLQTNNGSINLSNASNEFGAVRFVVGTGGAIISENTTFNLRAGSISTGPVQLNSNGSFVTSGAGGSSFTNDLTISALGTIIPSAGSLLVTGTLTVFSPSTKDLSALSKSGNLAGREPVNLGTGAYTGPSN